MSQIIKYILIGFGILTIVDFLGVTFICLVQYINSRRRDKK